MSESAPTSKVELVVSAAGGNEQTMTIPTWSTGIACAVFVVVVVILLYFMVPYMSHAKAMAIQLEDVKGEVRELRGIILKMATRNSRR